MVTLLLLYVGIGVGHHLYLEVRFQGDRFLSLDQRDDAAANLQRRPRHPDVETTLVDLTVSAHTCTAVPLKNSELLVTAAHCVVEDDYSIAGGGSIHVERVVDGARERIGLAEAEVLVHPRYLEVAPLEPLNGFQRIFLSAFTWATIRGTDRADSPYTWDVAVIRTPGRVWDFGVDGVTNEASGPYLVEAYQNFADDGTPVCTMDIVENCPVGTISSESISQTRSGVRCTVAGISRPSQVDGWVPCALMPGGSGGGVLITRDGKTLLYGLVTGGDAWGEGNGITVDAVVEFVAESLERVS